MSDDLTASLGVVKKMAGPTAEEIGKSLAKISLGMLSLIHRT
jgi:hypothetical protein